MRLTEQHIAEATPLTISEMQADKDALRARNLRCRCGALNSAWKSLAGQVSGSAERRDRQERCRNQPSLRRARQKKTALIFALRARDEVRKNAIRRIAKIFLYLLHGRSKRRGRGQSWGSVPEQHPLWDLGRSRGPSLNLGISRRLARLNVKRRQAVSKKLLRRPPRLFAPVPKPGDASHLL